MKKCVKVLHIVGMGKNTLTNSSKWHGGLGAQEFALDYSYLEKGQGGDCRRKREGAYLSASSFFSFRLASFRPVQACAPCAEFNREQEQ